MCATHANMQSSIGPPADLSRLCIHTITTRPWSLDEAIAHYASAGVAGITVWREALASVADLHAAGQRIRDAGLVPVSLCRGGFFPARAASDRAAALDDNRRAIDAAAALGAPLLVLVPGADPGQSLDTSRGQIREGIEAVLPYAAAAGVRLGVEALHPMYAAARSAINTLRQANELCEAVDSPWLGVVVDVYHLWWDPDLEHEIARAGTLGRLWAFHISDWVTPTDILTDRALMGEGCIPIRQIRGWMEQAGFDGYHEVEIFSTRRWTQEQRAYLSEIVAAYLAHG
jgi:sugar phosphate isomerase/epimerase